MGEDRDEWAGIAQDEASDITPELIDAICGIPRVTKPLDAPGLGLPVTLSRRGQPKSLHREKARDLRLAAAELVKAADAIDAMQPNALRHQQEREDIDPRAWVGLAERLVAGVKRGMGWE